MCLCRDAIRRMATIKSLVSHLPKEIDSIVLILKEFSFAVKSVLS